MNDVKSRHFYDICSQLKYTAYVYHGVIRLDDATSSRIAVNDYVCACYIYRLADICRQETMECQWTYAVTRYCAIVTSFTE